MSDRTINWGDPSDPGTTYQTGDDDPAGGGNFVVARDTDGGVTLLEYDPTAGEWVSRGDVNLNGNDLSANAIDVGSVSASDVLTAPKYPTRADVPDQNGLYRVEDVDGEGNFGVIVREV